MIPSIYANSDSPRLIRGSGNGGGGGTVPGHTALSPINVQLFPLAQVKGDGFVAMNGDAYGPVAKRGNMNPTGGGNFSQNFVANAPDTNRGCRGFAFVPNNKMLAGSMTTIFRMLTGSSNFQYYLWKLVGSAPQLIAKTAIFSPVLGLCPQPLETPVVIEPDSVYYMGYYCYDNTSNFRLLLDWYDNDLTTSPILTCADLNPQNIGDFVGIGAPTQYRPWMTLNEQAI